MGPHKFWRRGPVDHVRAYMLSRKFQASVQTATSEPHIQPAMPGLLS